MIEEKDLPLLLFLEQKLIESKNSSAFSFSSNMHSELKSQSHFNNLARILFKFDIAKPIKGNGNPDIVVISKTDLTGERRIQDIFNEEQKHKKREEIKNKAIITDLKAKKWYSLQNLLTIVSTLFAVLTFLYALNSDEEKNVYKSKIQYQQATIEKLISEKDSLQNRQSIQLSKIHKNRIKVK